MTDHAVLVPTSEGPVGGIVSEPDGEATAGLVLLPGYGRPARSGTNSFWTRMARHLCARGVVVLRIDYSREGETLPIGAGGSGQAWKRDLDHLLLRQVLPWFGDRLDGLDLHLAGSCSGARGAIELAGGDPDAIARTFLVVPHVRALEGSLARGRAGAGEQADAADAIDPTIVECFQAILSHAPSWLLVGERDDLDVPRLRQLVGPTPFELDVEVIPDVALHLLDQPRAQALAAGRVIARITRAVRGSQAHPATESA